MTNKFKISAIALCAISAYAFSQLSTQKSESVSILDLNSIEALASSENGCIYKDDKNDGDCTNDGTYYFCETSWWIDDCVIGSYPN